MSFPEFAAAVREAGIGAVGITRPALREMGIEGLCRCLQDNELGVSSLNSAGFFTGVDAAARTDFSNNDMVDAAAELGADTLTAISGAAGDPPLPLPEAHDMVKSGLAELAELAAAKGVTLGLEPIDPAKVLTTGCINSIAHGLQIIEPHDNVKLTLDVNHSWWDPDFPGILREAPEKVAVVQMCNTKSF